MRIIPDRDWFQSQARREPGRVSPPLPPLPSPSYSTLPPDSPFVRRQIQGDRSLNLAPVLEVTEEAHRSIEDDDAHHGRVEDASEAPEGLGGPHLVLQGKDLRGRWTKGLQGTF